MTQQQRLAAIDQLMDQAIKDKLFPGGELLLAQGDQLILHQAYGKTSGSDQASALSLGARYDLASLTKPMATAAAILKLWELDRLDLEQPLATLLPQWAGDKTINCLDLLTHRSGLPPWLPLYQCADRQAAWGVLMAAKEAEPSRIKVRYSCLNYIILGELVRLITGGSLASFCEQEIFSPLGLKSFGFNPGPEPGVLQSALCPSRGRRLQGEVQDENAALFDGEAGNAGLFGCAGDVWRFMRMLLNQGTLDGVQVLSPASAQLMIQNQNPTGLASRTVGWDYNDLSPGYWSCGSQLGVGSIGHLGYTGTGVWLDVKKQTFYIHLTHRVWYGPESKLAQMKAFRPQLHDCLSRLLE